MATIAVALILFVSYVLTLAVYRLYISPLRKIPGPRLAALSKFYEAYYEILLKGRFSFKLDELHERYGETNLCLKLISELTFSKDLSFELRQKKSTLKIVASGTVSTSSTRERVDTHRLFLDSETMTLCLRWPMLASIVRFVLH